MNTVFRLFAISLLLLASNVANAELVVLSYHDVDKSRQEITNTESMSVAQRDLTEQFSWLHANGYQVISVDQLIAANEGREPLPEKSVMLTFDDGYQGMYEKVFPLLKLFNYPAVLAVMGKWLETPAGDMVAYGASDIARDKFLSWHQIKEMVDSGLVEVASHSYDLHHGVQSNPQGNQQPAATTFIYDAQSKRYETEHEYHTRIKADLKRNADLIQQRVGQKVRVMVWPYGAYNQVTVEIAKALAMPVAMSLDNGHTDIKNIGNVNRLLVGNYSDTADFVWLINNQMKQPVEPVRVMHVDLDYVYDPDAKQQEHNLGLLLDRVKLMGINTVYLQAFADPDGDGNANALYFPNRHLPMRADLFDRVSWQLRTRSGVDVYAWMPVMSFDLPALHPLARHRVQASPVRVDEDYRRFSPFSDDALQFVGDIYEDLAKYSKMKGLIFHDDAYLNDHEDTSPWALKAYQGAGFSTDISAIKKDPEEFKRWTLFKSQAMANWTDVLTARAHKYQMDLTTARNMYASVIMNPASSAWFGQSMAVFLESYDYTAIMAMPYMEDAKDPEAWLTELVMRVASIPGALDKSVFELQSVDWKKQQAIPSQTLAKHMRLLLRNGAKHYGYYPDNFIQATPDMDIIRPVFSLSKSPIE